jgi:branched-chain amino acid transport system substrate-binding protein
MAAKQWVHASVAAFFTISAASAAANQTAAVTDSKVVIHHIGPFTGVLASSNKENLDGARLYFDAVNAKGGVNGRQIVLETLDDKQDAKETARLFKELIEQKKILTLFLPRTTPSTEAVSAIAQEEKIPVFAPQNGGAIVTTPFKRYVFAVRASYQEEVVRAIKLQHSIGARSFAFVTPTDAFGKDAMSGADRAMKELKIQAAAIENFDNRNPDMRQAVTNLLKIKPDVVMIFGANKASSEFIKDYRAAGGYAQFISLSNASNNEFVKALGEYARGSIVMQVMPSPYSPTTRVAREFIALAKDKKASVSYASMQGYISAKALVEGMRRAGKGLTSESLVKGLESFNEFDLGDYTVQFDKDTRLGSVFVDSTIINSTGRFMR